MKKILFIAAKFFHYHEIIMSGIRDMGYQVTWYNDRPSTNSLVKAAIRLRRNSMNMMIQRYFDQIFSEIVNQTYDIVFVISGQSLSFTPEMFAKIRDSQPQAHFILYQWDAIDNFIHIKDFFIFFDRKYTFDPMDAKNYEGFQFLPLFYHPGYEQVAAENPILRYDLCFIGTAHPKKYEFVNQVLSCCNECFPNRIIYMYLPSRLLFFYRKLTDKARFQTARFGDFRYTQLRDGEVSRLIGQSKYILDSPQSCQTGLTMRTIECLGAKKKVITANKDIVNYDMYREENFYVFEGNLDVDAAFFKKPYCTLPKELYQKYSLRSWLNTMF